jgi:hypothetical protein
MQRSPRARLAGLGVLAVLMAVMAGFVEAPRRAEAQPLQSQFLSVAIDATGDVVVSWRDTPGNATDWISVVHAGAGDDTYEATWTYTGQQSSGAYNAGKLAPGAYEARLYLDWPAGGYLVIDRLGFEIGAVGVSDPAVGARYLSVGISTSGDAIVFWVGTPGNNTDWVSVVRAGTPDDQYESTWTYTNGETSGSYNAGSLPPGDYEARLYLDWPTSGYLVVDRVAFRVR